MYHTTQYPWLTEGDAGLFNNDYRYNPGTEIVHTDEYNNTADVTQDYDMEHGFRDYQELIENRPYDQMLIDAVNALPRQGDTETAGIYHGNRPIHTEWWRVTHNFGGADAVNNGRALYQYYARELNYDFEHLQGLELDAVPVYHNQYRY